MIIAAAALMVVAVLLVPWRFCQIFACAAVQSVGERAYQALPQSFRHQLHKAALLTQQSQRVLQRVLGCFVLGLAITIVGGLIANSVLIWLGAAGMGLVVLRLVSMHRAGQQRLQSMVNALPAQLDLLAMLLASGLPLLASLQRSSDGLLQNPLRLELRTMIGHIRAGESMETSLQRFAETFAAREIRLFCGALNHARESGASLADILREQARHRRNELFLQAEQKALEAPVKLMLPLLTCIFPTALILLVVVLSAKLMWQL
ncbi:type II secretion system F family protein [Aliidiomarina sp. Khilg15.8]